jgi:arylsulfatase A
MAGLKLGLCRIDGRSFLPQLRGRKGEPREWVYSWYSPRQSRSMAVRECAFNARFKLCRPGEFFDMAGDLEEKNPLSVPTLKGEAAASAKVLQDALDRYQNARPAELDRLFEQARKNK